MKVWIDVSEEYPVFSMIRREDDSLETVCVKYGITEEEWAYYNRVLHEYKYWQDRLKTYSEAINLYHKLEKEKGQLRPS